MREYYLDNIRWITICLVVIFHVFFYYNNIGTPAMFAGLPEYTGQLSFAGLFQYFVYPWFMLILFVVSGTCARIYLQKKTEKEFLKSRIHKLLVPSTLGILTFGWIGGYVIYLYTIRDNLPAETPKIVGAFISVFTGIGALWFCHVLFVAVLVLIFLRKILHKMFRLTDDKICEWVGTKAESKIGFIVICIAMYLILWGGSHVLNMPYIISYRNGIYIPTFLFGFYIFSNISFVQKLRKLVWVFGTLSAGLFILYIPRNYGKYYADLNVLSSWEVNLYALLMVLFVMGFIYGFVNFTNRFMSFMTRKCFGIYVLHIPVMLITNYLLRDVNLSLVLKYCIEGFSGFTVSLILYEIIIRIPLLRYCILGLQRR